MGERAWFAVGVSAGMVLRFWRLSLRRSTRNRVALAEPCVIAVWHGRLVGVLMDLFGSGLVTMASRSPDGAFAAGAVRAVGLRPARGSSSRGGRQALGVMEEALAEGAPLAGLTVDGPRGPWRQVKAGVAALAIRAGLPLVPATFSCRTPRVLSSWDRMVLPAPFTRMVVAYGDPWSPEHLRDAGKEGLEAIKAQLDELTDNLDREVAGRELWAGP